jgi:hypothetical protein
MKSKKYNLTNIKAFLQGYTRIFAYRLLNTLQAKGYFKNLTLEFLKEERFKYRVKNANLECLKNGKCLVCSCDVPELFMSDKGCEVNCYKE